MKTCTDIDQSKVLAEILPQESADMFWLVTEQPRIHVITESLSKYDRWENYPAWSLTALLDAMPPIQELCSSTDHYYRIHCMNLFSEWHDNAIDSCVEMIVKLQKKGLL